MENTKGRKWGHEFTEVRQLILSSGQKGREILLINQLHNIIYGDNATLYIVRDSVKKKKPTSLNSDQKWTQNHIRKLPEICGEHAFWSTGWSTCSLLTSTAQLTARLPRFLLKLWHYNRSIRLSTTVFCCRCFLWAVDRTVDCNFLCTFVHGRSTDPLSLAENWASTSTVELRSLCYFLW